MLTMRYQTYRRIVFLGSWLLFLCFLGMIFFRTSGWVIVFEILFWAMWVGGTAFHVIVRILRATGNLEFTYTDADRSSMLYNAEQLHRQMKEWMRSRKND